jgi:hypothetical protein
VCDVILDTRKGNHLGLLIVSFLQNFSLLGFPEKAKLSLSSGSCCVFYTVTVFWNTLFLFVECETFFERKIVPSFNR